MPSSSDNGVIKWSSTSSGLWSDAANWSTGTVPDSAMVKVAITASGAWNYDVTIDSPETVGVLRVGSADADLVVGSSLQVHSLEISQGIVELSAGGTISGGKIVVDGSSLFYADGGTLTGAALDGTVLVDHLTLGDAAFRGSNGSGQGTIILGSENDTPGTLTLLAARLDNAEVDIAGGTLQEAGAQRLVIGAGTLIEASDFSANDADGFIENASGDGILNLGTINADFGLGVLHIDATGFRNEGRIILDKGFTLDFDGVTTGGALTRVIDSIDNSGGSIGLAGTVATGRLDAAIVGAGGTLAAVHYEGTLALTGLYDGPDVRDGLTITGGTSFAGKDGKGAGSIAVAGGAVLDFAGSATLDNATLTLGTAASDDPEGLYRPGAGYLQTSDIGGDAATLTLGRHLVIDVLGDGELGPAPGGGGDLIVNDGTIDVAGPDAELGVAVGNFVNDGRVVIDHGSFLVLDGGTSGNGTFSSAAALATIASITRLDGGVGIDGTMSGGVFDHDIDQEFSQLGTLSNVAFQGTLTIGAQYSADYADNLTIEGSTTFAGTGGAGRATIDVLGGGLVFQTSMTLDNVLVRSGSGNGDERIGVFDLGGASSVLTFGANATIQQAGTFFYLTDVDPLLGESQPGGGFVNDGRINLTYSGGLAGIDASQFTNNGLIIMASQRVSFGPSFADEAVASFTNAGRIVIENAYLQLSRSSFTNATSGSVSLASSSGATATLAGTNENFVNNGTMILTGAGTDTVTADIVNAATITANATSLTFTGPVTNNGTIAESGQGIAAFKTSLLGTGTLDIAGHGTAALTGAAATQVVDFTDATGALALYTPATFLGTIAGFAAGDAISLVKTPSNGFTFANGVLTVTENGASVASLHFAGSYTQGDFSVGTARSGSTVITHS